MRGLNFTILILQLLFPNSQGFKVKKKESTFFPDAWTKEKLHQEIALAFGNKICIKGNQYKGKMSDGVNLIFHIDNDIIKSAYPSFKKLKK